eukprot:SAG25_NODE_13206_length_270_cov_0.602339_1_plen_57_part_01
MGVGCQISTSVRQMTSTNRRDFEPTLSEHPVGARGTWHVRTTKRCESIDVNQSIDVC